VLTELTSRKLEGEGPDKGQDGLCPANGRPASPRIKDTNNAQLNCHGCHAPDIDCSASKVPETRKNMEQNSTKVGCLRHEEEPIAEAGKERKAVGPNAQRVGCLCVQADLLKEIGAGVSKAKTTNKLTAEDDHGDFCAASLEAFEAVPVSSSNLDNGISIFRRFGGADGGVNRHGLDKRATNR